MTQGGDAVARATGVWKRLFIGPPLRSAQLEEQLLPKWLALPVFCSDPISSVAYATEEIVLVLAAGGVAYLADAKWVAVVVAALLVVVVASYRQTCHAYPNGGGSYMVSATNLGENASLVAAAALLVDYVMTVTVSTVSGIVAVTSAIPSMHRYAVEMSVAAVVLLTLVNLRGVKESGKAFAFPTYAFIALTLLMFAVGGIHWLAGGLPLASTAHQLPRRSVHVGGLFTLLLLMRAFASGCTALTGVEAISNGVPAFRRPKSQNAARTLTMMGTIAVTLFVGVTVFTIELHAHAQASGNPSVISQLAAAIYGRHAALFYLFQAATAAILVLAANTAFNGFPVLASILAQDRFLPRQLYNRGDRLVFSNGIVLLAVAAIALIIGFDANLDKLIQLYIVGVFTAFTLSQSGMIRHWTRHLAGTADDTKRRRMRRSRLVNATGSVATGAVLVVVLYTKLPQGAYIAVAAMVALFVLMKRIRRHYDRVAGEIEVEASERPVLPARNHVIVLVSRVSLPVLRALSYARTLRPATLEAVTAAVDDTDAQRIQDEWDSHHLDVPLRILSSPYREITRPVLDYVRGLRRHSPRDVVTVVIPEYVVGHWWEQLLHNQSALRLKSRLLFEPGVAVTSVPWQLHGAENRAAWLRAEDDEPPRSSVRQR